MCELLGQFVSDVGRIEIGKDQDIGLTCDAALLPDLLGSDDRRECRVSLKLPVDQEIRHFRSNSLHSCSHLIYSGMFGAAVGGKRQKRDPWTCLEQTSCTRG